MNANNIVTKGCYRLFNDGEFVEEESLTFLCKKYDFNYNTVSSAVLKYGSYKRDGWEMMRHVQKFRITDLSTNEQFILEINDVYDFFGVARRKSALNQFFKVTRNSRYRLEILTYHKEEK